MLALWLFSSFVGEVRSEHVSCSSAAPPLFADVVDFMFCRFLVLGALPAGGREADTRGAERSEALNL